MPHIFLAATHASSSHSSVFIWVIAGLILVVGVPLSLWRLRRGGPGPAMNWIPRSMRGKANEQYDKHGWQEPFDDDGDPNPDRSSL